MLKKIKTFFLIIIMSLLNTNIFANYDKLAYDFNFNDIDGELLSLSKYKNKVIIVINVASQCGFTKQYEDMQKIWQTYQEELNEWAGKNEIRQPVIPKECEPAWHLYYLLMPSKDQRDALIMHLQNKGINAVSHYLPLHLSSYIRNSGLKQHTLPVTENTSKCLIRLPLWGGLTDEELNNILKALKQFAQ